MLYEITISEWAFISTGFMFVAFSIFFFYLYYKYKLRKIETLEKSEKYTKGTWKHFWYYNQEKIFIFLSLTSILIALAFFVSIF